MGWLPGLELGRYWGLEAHGLVVDGMMEAELPGVQHEAGDVDDLALGVAIDGVSQDGVADVCAVLAQLVCAACLWL